jgi:hypothetical protein
MNDRPLRTYILTFNFTGQNFNFAGLHQYITDSKDLAAYWNYIPFVYMIKSRLLANELFQKFHAVMDDAQFVVAEINPQNIQGWVPQPAWDWIYADHDQQQRPLSFESIMKLLQDSKKE